MQRHGQRLYLKVITRKTGNAIHILDRFHIMAHMRQAIGEARAKEVKEPREKGRDPLLTKSRWLLRKRGENSTEQQESKLAELVKQSLKAVRSYLLKEEFQLFRLYESPYWAKRFLENWREKTMRSKSSP
uniref:Transposase n=1 Tax=Candidatus Kentrum sp. SD TaxID=2126332 RepID=A0A451BQB8_9GAMM|nr:MAG: Transposase [Candidatus Kentron sp. SD]